MRATGCEVLLVVSDGHNKGDVRYLTNHSIWSQRAYAIIAENAGPFLCTPMVSQQYWAKLTGWATDIRSSATPIRDAVGILRSLMTAGQTLGISGMRGLMPLEDHEHLTAYLPDVTVRDMTDLMQSVRAVKSDE